MLHPAVYNKRFAISYIIAWAFIEVFHFFILSNEYAFPIGLSAIDSLVSNFIFCLIGLTLWYPVYYSQGDDLSNFNRIVNVATSGIVSIAIWYGLSYLALKGVYKGYEHISFNTLHHWRIQSGIFYFLIVLFGYYIVEYQNKIKDKQANEELLQMQLKEAELLALKSQINPHFLFNSLNSISSLTMYEPSKAQEMIIKLSEYLRYTVSAGKKELTTYKEEVENIKRYLEIEHIRFGQRIDFRIDPCEMCNGCLLPTLILQPLVENAIKHGVNESTDTVTVRVSAQFTEKGLTLSIQNDCPDSISITKGTGTGLKNIKSRLALLYGESQLMKITKAEGIYRVDLVFPQKQSL